MKVIISAALAAVLLYALSWPWSAAGGVVAGLWTLRRGWLNGGVAVALAWTAFVGWSHLVAPAEVGNLMQAAEGFVSAPGWLLPFASIALGFVLGAAGGFVGSSLAELVARHRRNDSMERNPQ